MKKCERCGKIFVEEPALSRKDNKTKICSHCGFEEALEEFKKFLEENE